jgi:DNA-binding MarR family transcriptional regulator
MISPPRSRRQATPGPRDLADRLHSAAIHLLRRLRTSDDASGLSAPQLSVLSVLGFGGRMTLSRLAAVEQVRPPTMTRLIAQLSTTGLVRREPDPDDRRRIWVECTELGRRLMLEGRARRVAVLEADLRRLPPAEFRRLASALGILEGVARPHGRPTSKRAAGSRPPA